MIHNYGITSKMLKILNSNAFFSDMDIREKPVRFFKYN